MSHAPSGRWPIACFVALGLYAGAWGALIPDLKRQVGATDGELGLALLCAAVGTIPGMLLAGRLWRRVGRLLLPASALAFAIALIGPMVATSSLALGGALLLTGASSGALDVAMNASVSDVEASRGTRLMYGAHALFSAGAFVASVATGLARSGGAQPVHVLVVVAAVMAFAGVGAIADARSTGPLTPPTRDHQAAGGSLVPALLLGLAVLCAISFLIEDAVQNWSALHLERGLGSGPALGGAAPGIFAGAMFVGRVLGQRFGSLFSERALLSIGAAAAAVGLGILAATPSVAAALVALAVAGGGIALVAPALYTRVGRLAEPSGRAAAIARMTVFGYTGYLLGPPLIGGVSQVAGLPMAIWTLALMAAVLALSGAIILGSRQSVAAAARQTGGS